MYPPRWSFDRCPVALDDVSGRARPTIRAVTAGGAPDRPIRVVARTPQGRGAVFAARVADVFLTLGYHRSETSRVRSGREIDLVLANLTERKYAIAECKATDDPIGAPVVNKFAGVLARERIARERTAGYVVSLSGFTAPALRQEEEESIDGLTLLDAARVVQLLTDGQVVVRLDRAAGEAARWAALHDETLEPDGEPTLLCSYRAWIWRHDFRSSSGARAVVLVHGDGRALGRARAETLFGDEFVLLNELGDALLVEPRRKHVDPERVESEYRDFLRRECGLIELDGLPADDDAARRAVALHELFVPLRLAGAARAAEPDTLGDLLASNGHFAILGPPGCGKSTLIRRVALAYAGVDSVRNDPLPRRAWLPVLIRCRDLRSTADAPLGELLAAVAAQANLSCGAEEFADVVRQMLREGRVLLLVDGLDEIADPRLRNAFARRVRSVIGQYPTTTFLLTSREAGFRDVAPVLAGVCATRAVLPLDREAIGEFVENWQRLSMSRVLATPLDVSQFLARLMAADRVRTLATNPLLLTILLLVYRWVRELPRGRAVLYRRMVEVLLMTWNVDAHEPIPEDEALPQLAVVAHTMTVSGKPRVRELELRRLLTAARERLPGVLAYTKASVPEFIARVESRTSLLMMVGHEVVGDALVPVYEFRHLSIQEYLTAYALAHRLVDDPLLDDASDAQLVRTGWGEVVPLLITMIGPEAEAFLRRVSLTVASTDADDDDVDRALGLVASCLGEAPAIAPAVVRELATMLASHPQWNFDEHPKVINEIVSSRIGNVFVTGIYDGVLEGGPALRLLGRAAAHCFRARGPSTGPNASDGEAAGMMLAAAHLATDPWSAPRADEDPMRLYPCVVRGALSDHEGMRYAAWQALRAMAARGGWSLPASSPVIRALVNSWRQDSPTLALTAQSALLAFPIVAPGATQPPDPKGLSEFLRLKTRHVLTRSFNPDATAAAVVMYYGGAPYDQWLSETLVRADVAHTPTANRIRSRLREAERTERWECQGR